MLLHRTLSVQLSGKRRAEFYEELGRLVEMGLSPEQVLRELARSCPEPLRRRVLRAAGLVGAGHALSRAGTLAGLLGARDTALLQVAEAAGHVPRALLALAAHHRARAMRLHRARVQAVYPVAIAVVAIFAMPLPAFSAGQMDARAYLTQTFVPLGAIILVLMALGHLLRWLGKQRGSVWLTRAQLSTPGIGALTMWRARADALQTLAMFLTAGMPATRALDETLANVSRPCVRERFSPAARALADGQSLADALLVGGLLDRKRGYSLASTGEAAGRLDETMERLARDETVALEATLDELAYWTPRLLYFASVIFLSVQFLFR